MKIDKNDAWIEWHGGDCPVDSDAIVEIKNRMPIPFHFNNDRAGDFDWEHNGSSSDIIAYRLHKPTKSEQVRADAWRAYAGIKEKDEEVELNECIGQGVVTEWDGDGLPPVGCECEVSVDGGNTWCSYKALNEKNGMRLVEIGNFTEDFQSNNWTFRPMRTEADKKRDEAIKGMTSVIDYRNGCSSKPMAGWLYDAIAAGKIPGVKLEGK